jgi:hypothetical protein
MNRPAHSGVLALVIAVMLTACSRHVVIEPEMVGTRNQSDWTINSVPTSAPTSTPPNSTAPNEVLLPPPPNDPH